MSDGFVPLRGRHEPLSRSNLRSRIPLPFKAASGNRSPSYEAFYEPKAGWNRDRIWSGVTLPLNKRVFVQPSYMWESSEGNRDVHYVLFGLIVNTR